MTEVPDFEELLAALDDDTSKVHHLTQHESTLGAHSSTLGHGQPPLHSDLHFGSMQPSGVDIPNGVHLLGQGAASQHIVGIGQGLGHMPNPLLHDQQVFHSHVHAEDDRPLTLQGGSSLGSLFLSSVDEILSNEKPPQDFVSPTTQSAPLKPGKPKIKKVAQKKGEKFPSSLLPKDPPSVGQSASFKPGPSKSQQSRPSQNATFNVPTRPHSNTSVLSTSDSYIGPHSNASGDGSLYSGNLPQPSPAGSVDSNFAPRTPLSNNPLTPQSGHQPLTPQSGHGLQAQQSLSNPGTPIQQIHQQSRSSHLENDFMSSFASSSLPPDILDDQSHLQYLNTTTTSRHVNATDQSDDNLLDDLPSTIKTGFEQDGFSTSRGLHAPGITASTAPSLGWPREFSQFSVAPSQQQLLGAVTSANQVNNLFAQTPQVGSSTAQNVVHTPSALGATTGQSNMQTLYTQHPSGISSMDQQLVFAHTGQTQNEGLTQTQSQILENFSEWGKPKSVAKSKPTQATLAYSGLNANVPVPTLQSGPGLFLDAQSTTAVVPTASVQPKVNTVLDMLSTAETGIKQRFSSTYEAISPISDYSPAGDQKAPDVEHGAAHMQQRMPGVTLSQSQISPAAGGVGKAKVGPIARRRSASAERRITPVSAPAPKVKQVSNDFNFEDEFGFNQNEPTIKLPSQRLEDGSRKPLPSFSVPEPTVNPIMPVHREVYSDQSIYDSVQEIAALQQKQKTLMEALQARKAPSQKSRVSSASRVAAPDVGLASPSSGHPKASRTSSKKKSQSVVPAQHTAGAPGSIVGVSPYADAGQATMPVNPKPNDDGRRPHGNRATVQHKHQLAGRTNPATNKSQKQNNAPIQMPTQESTDQQQDTAFEASNDLIANWEMLFDKSAGNQAPVYENNQSKTNVDQTNFSNSQPKFTTGNAAHMPFMSSSLPVIENQKPLLPAATTVSVDSFFANFTTRAESISTSVSMLASSTTNSRFNQNPATYSQSFSASAHQMNKSIFSEPVMSARTREQSARSLETTKQQLQQFGLPAEKHKPSFAPTSAKLQQQSLLITEPVPRHQLQTSVTQAQTKSAAPQQHLGFGGQSRNVHSSSHLGSMQQSRPMASVTESLNVTGSSVTPTLATYSSSKIIPDFDPFPATQRSAVSTAAPPTRTTQRSHQPTVPKRAQQTSQHPEPLRQRVTTVAASTQPRSTTSHAVTQSLQNTFLAGLSSSYLATTQSSAAPSSSSLITQPPYSTVLSSAPNTIMYTAAPLSSQKPAVPNVTVKSSAPISKRPLAVDHGSKHSPSPVFPYSAAGSLPSQSQSFDGAHLPDLLAQYLSDPQKGTDLRAREAYATFASGRTLPSSLNPFSAPAPVVPDEAAISQSLRRANERRSIPSAPSTASALPIAGAPHGVLPTYQQSLDQAKTGRSSLVDSLPSAVVSQQHAVLPSTEQRFHSYTNKSAPSNRRPSRDAFQPKDMERILSPKIPLSADLSTTSNKSHVSSVSLSPVMPAVTSMLSRPIAVSSSSSAIEPWTPAQKLEKDARNPGTISILKDKTYHGPKKKHILEKYSQEYPKPVHTAVSKTGKTSLDAAGNGTAFGSLSSSVSAGLAPVQSGTNSVISAINTRAISSAPEVTCSSNKTTVSTVSTAPHSGSPVASKNNTTPVESEEKMLSLFDSLLQEASESAAGSLKNAQTKKQEAATTSTTANQTATAMSKPSFTVSKPPTAVSKPSTAVSIPFTTVSKPSTAVSKPSTAVSKPSTAVSKPFTAVSKRSTAVSKPSTAVSKPSTAVSKPSTAVSKPSTAVSKPSTAVSEPSTAVSKPSTAVSKPFTAALITTTRTSTAKTSSTSSNKPIPTKVVDVKTASRSPATFPFKRRYVPAYHSNADSVQLPKAVSADQSATTVVATAPGPSGTVVSVTPVATVTKSVAARALLSSTAVSAAPPVTTSATENTDAASAKTSGLKLRITAFRSAAGQVIHHAAVVDPTRDDDDSDVSHKKKKHKKHKKKKRKKRSSVSDSDASHDPKLAVIPSVTTAAQTVQPQPAPAVQTEPAQTNKIQAKLVPQLRLVIPSDEPAIDSATSASGKKRKRQPAAKKQQPPPPKKSRTLDAADVEPGEPDQTAKKSAPVAKKRAPKATTRMRYKPKISSANDVTSEVLISAPLVLNRIPGRTPMYMQANTNQAQASDSSSSVPTIHLAPRSVAKSTAKTISQTVISPVQSAAKALSVKLSVALTKPTVPSVQAHVMTKNTLGGVRYLLQSSPSGGGVSLPPRAVVPKHTVGRATVVTVSASGARVTPSIQQTQVNPTQPAATSAIASPALTVKRVPISLISKVAVPTSPIVIASASVLCSKSSVTTSITSPVLSHAVQTPISLVKAPTAPEKTALTPTSTTSALKLPPANRPTYTGISAPTIKETAASVKSGHSKSVSESQFQTAFSNLISSPNPLAKYVPPPLPQNFAPLGTTMDSHRCFECGDSFLFGASLHHHYERRSILVKVRCVQCSQMLVFFNKCEILRHAREHSERGDVMQFNGAQLSPIPLSLCKPRTKEYFLRIAGDRKKIELATPTSGSLVCTDCHFVGDNQCSLEEHFQRRTAEGESCDICKLHLHNNCAFSAHMRMHRHLAPHTCPECGVLFDEHAMDFNLHLRMQCFHLSRVSCFKCKLCNLTFLTNDQLRNHLRLNHVQLFYKCRECPMAFKTTQNIANHQRTAHNLTPEPTNTLKTIYKCPLCDTVFTDSSHSQQLFVLHKHFDTHINSTRITAYKCYVCSNIFEQKSMLREHLQEQHDMSSLTELASSVPGGCAIPEEHHNDVDRKRATIDAKRSSKAAKKIKLDQIKAASVKQLPDREPDRSSVVKNGVSTQDVRDANSTRAISEGKKKNLHPFKIRMKSKTSSHQISPSSGNDAVSVLIDADGRKTYPCTECDKVFMSTHSRSSHVRSVHRGIRTLYCCPHCPAGRVKFAKKVTLGKHLAKDHQIVNPQKDDVKTIRTHIPYLSPGSKLNASTVNLDKLDPVARIQFDRSEERRFPRKKITTRNPAQARARRLAAVSEQHLKKARQRVARRLPSSTNEESDESYGEVDEKTIEEGWNVPDEMDAENSDVEGDVDVSSLRLPSIYTCIKCDFQHEDRLTFQDHIVEHSQTVDSVSNGTAAVLTMVQCTECGLCFASTASLDKHMYIKHKIRHRKVLERYDARLREERAGSDQSRASVNSEQSGASCAGPKLHRCKVCFRKFDSDTDLRTHMRTHGLAFVRSKAN